MKASRTLCSLSVLAVLAVCAFAAQTASAQTWYECAPAKPGVFKDAHCKEAGSPAEGFAHVALPANVWIPVTWSNETTGGARSIGKLRSMQSGVTLELQSTLVEGTGEIQNRKEGETTWGEGFGTVVYKNVTVTAPVGQGCEVVGGQITTNKLRGTTKGLTNELKFEPFEGTTFATFEIKGCSLSAINHVYIATGSVKGTKNGTTTEFVHGQTSPVKTGTTGQETLKLFGQNAGLEFSTTLKRVSTGNGIAQT